MNNVDIAEAMIEVCNQAMKEYGPETPVTWVTLSLSLQTYIIKEQHEIEKLRKLKDKPFG